MRYRESRPACDAEAALLLGGERRLVRFVDLGPAGARVEGLGRVPRDAAATLAPPGRRIAARVIWSNGLQAGLRFDEPLSAAELDALRGRGGPGPRPRGLA